MAELNKLTDAQVRNAIAAGEFGDDVIRSSRCVAVVMSQSWCPQWHMVERWLGALPCEAEIDIYSVVYDNEPFFEEFMRFKETVFRNHQVPYIRYYIDGRLVKETNYTSKDFFLKVFA